MPTFYASPTFWRPGVVAGFILGIGSGLVASLTKGVLFAGGAMYRPADAPVVPAAPASARSWLCYSASTGFYWRADAAVVDGDALIGWVLTNDAQVLAYSVRKVNGPGGGGTTGGGSTSGSSGAGGGGTTPQPVGPSAGPVLVPFFPVLDLADLAVGDDIADHKIVYKNRTLIGMYATLRKAITADLTVRFNALIEGTSHPMGTFTIPATTTVGTVLDFSSFTYRNSPNLTTITVDIVASDSSKDRNGIAQFLLVLSPSDSGEAAPSDSPGSVTHTSGNLTKDEPVFGNDGGDITIGSRSGNTTEVVTTTGQHVEGHGGKWDASGNWVDNGRVDVAEVPATRKVETTYPLTGGGDLGADRTLAIRPFVLAVVNNGEATTDAAPMNPARTAGSVTQCVVRIVASDPDTDLTFDLTQNGASVLYAPITVAKGTAADTISTFALGSESVAIARHDIFKLNIVSGGPSWKFTVQLE